MAVFRSLVLKIAVACLLVAVVAPHATADTASLRTPLDLSAYRGKVVLLDFWASWCVPCRRSFPWMNQMQRKYAGDDLVIIAVNMDRTADAADAFLKDFPADFKIVRDPDGTLARKYKVIAMPSSYLIGRDGTIIQRHLGFKVRQQKTYEAAILAALKKGTR